MFRFVVCRTSFHTAAEDENTITILSHPPIHRNNNIYLHIKIVTCKILFSVYLGSVIVVVPRYTIYGGHVERRLWTAFEFVCRWNRVFFYRIAFSRVRGRPVAREKTILTYPESKGPFAYVSYERVLKGPPSFSCWNPETAISVVEKSGGAKNAQKWKTAKKCVRDL